MVYRGGSATSQTKSPVHYGPNQLTHLPSVIRITASVGIIAFKTQLRHKAFFYGATRFDFQQPLSAGAHSKAKSHAAPQQQVSSVSHLLSGGEYARTPFDKPATNGKLKGRRRRTGVNQNALPLFLLVCRHLLRASPTS